jgi:hypothetical protein
MPLLRCYLCDHIVADSALKCPGCGTKHFKGSTPFAPTTSGAIRVLKGVNGQLELFPDKVVIRRKGVLAFMTQGVKGDTTIRLESITGVQLKPGGVLLNGYIQFTLPGGLESRGGIFDATKDPNTIMFRKASNSDAATIKNYIEDWKTNRGTFESGSTTHVSVADELRKLKSLYDDGVLSKQEFERQKQRLIAG